MNEPDPVSIARALSTGDTAAVRQTFDATMAASPAVSDDELRRVWDSVVGQVGAFLGADDAEVFTTYQVPLRFERGRAVLRVTYDHESKVAGLVITPSW